MKAQINLNIKVEIIKTTNGYNAMSDIFAATGIGATKGEALKSLKGCLQSTFDYCLEKGTLLNALEKEGFNQKMVLPKTTKSRSFKALNYNIPLGNYGKEKGNITEAKYLEAFNSL